jgi:hypothetical protein
MCFRFSFCCCCCFFSSSSSSSSFLLLGVVVLASRISIFLFYCFPILANQ